MLTEILTWFGVGAVVLLAWTLYISAPREDEEDRTSDE
jgi:hypothetical protein